MPVSTNPYFDYFIDFAIPQSDSDSEIYETLTHYQFAHIFKELIQYLNEHDYDNDLWAEIMRELKSMNQFECATLQMLSKFAPVR